LRGISYQEMCLKRPSMVGQYLDELAELMCVMQFAVDYNNISKRNQGLVNYEDYMNLRENFYMEFKNMYTPHKYELADEECEDEIKWEENVDTSRPGSHTNVEEPYAMFRGNHINVSPINSTLHNETSRTGNHSRSHSVRTRRSHSRERFLSEPVEDDMDEEGQRPPSHYGRPRTPSYNRQSEIVSLMNKAAKGRSPINIQDKWDGSLESFDKYKAKIEGHLLQVGAGYLINPEFIESYYREGNSFFSSEEFYNNYKVSTPQAINDREYLYGVLQSSTNVQSNFALTKHARTKDSIKVWDK